MTSDKFIKILIQPSKISRSKVPSTLKTGNKTKFLENARTSLLFVLEASLDVQTLMRSGAGLKFAL